MAMKCGDFPVIVAGGIYTHEDIATVHGNGSRRRPDGHPLPRNRREQRHGRLQAGRRPGPRRGYRGRAPARLSLRPSLPGHQAVSHVCLLPEAAAEAEMRQGLCPDEGRRGQIHRLPGKTGQRKLFLHLQRASELRRIQFRQGRSALYCRLERLPDRQDHFASRPSWTN